MLTAYPTRKRSLDWLALKPTTRRRDLTTAPTTTRTLSPRTRFSSWGRASTFGSRPPHRQRSQKILTWTAIPEQRSWRCAAITATRVLDACRRHKTQTSLDKERKRPRMLIPYLAAHKASWRTLQRRLAKRERRARRNRRKARALLTFTTTSRKTSRITLMASHRFLLASLRRLTQRSTTKAPLRVPY